MSNDTLLKLIGAFLHTYYIPPDDFMNILGDILISHDLDLLAEKLVNYINTKKDKGEGKCPENN